MYYIFIIGLFFGILSARISTVALREQVREENLPLRTIIGFLSMISSYALLIWGFVNL